MALLKLDWQCGGALGPTKFTYYGNIVSALHKDPHVRGRCNVETHDGESLCTIAFGHTCTTATTVFVEQVQAAERRLNMSLCWSGANASVAAVFLNKVYMDLPGKLDAVRRLARHRCVRRVFVFSWSPVVGLRPPVRERATVSFQGARRESSAARGRR